MHNTVVARPAALDRKAAAAYCGLRPSTLAKLAMQDRGVPFVKSSPDRQGRVRYLVSDLDAWLLAGMPRDRTGARPPNCPKFSRPAGEARRDPSGRFARRPPGS
jgi:hypothetical protein